MIRAMLTAFGSDQRLWPLADQYMLGDSILVKPVTRPLADGGSETAVTLPEGGWYDLFTRAYYAADNTLKLDTPLNRFPVFVRAGSILPWASGACSAADLPFPAEELLVFSGADGDFILYDDSGDGMDYLQGAFLRLPMHWHEKHRILSLDQAEGTLPVDAVFRITLICPDGQTELKNIKYTGVPLKIAF